MIQSIRSLRTRLPVWGFTLIELAIVLGVAGLLFAGLWRLMSGGNQQLRDQAAASSQIQLISAVKNYLASSDGQTYMKSKNTNMNPFALGLPATNTDLTNCKGNYAPGSPLQTFCTYLPAGFSQTTVNPYGQNFTIQIIGDGTGNIPSTYSFMILTSGGNAIPDSSGGRISASIGGDGGFVYSNNVCGNNPSVQSWACGAYGTWSVKVTDYGFAAPATGGYIASRSYYAPEQISTQPWLARSLYPGNVATSPDFNTMKTSLIMALPAAGANANSLYLNAGPAATPTIAPAAGTDNIYMGGGAINMGGGGILMAGAGPAVANAITGVTGGITTAGGSIDITNGAAAGSIALGSGTITSTTPTTLASLSLTTDATKAPAIQVNGGCTLQLNPACTFGAINLQTGDLNVATGQIKATAFYYTSDVRLKTNIQPIHDGLAGIEKLKPVSYNFKATGMASLGIIAQDVEKVYPTLVQTGADGYKSVAYNGLIAPLISAVQELKKENDDLRQELQKQSARQEKLELMLNNKKQP